MHVQVAHWPYAWRAWHSYSMHMRSCSICMCMYCYICCRGRTAMLCMYTRAVHAYICMCCCATVHVLLRCCAAAGTCAHMYKGCYKGIIIKYGRRRTRRDASSIYTCTYTYALTFKNSLKVISSPNEKIGQLHAARALVVQSFHKSVGTSSMLSLQLCKFGRCSTISAHPEENGPWVFHAGSLPLSKTRFQF